MSMAAQTYKPGTFARFFRAVPGRLVSRFGTQHYGTPNRKTKAIPFRNAQIIGGRRPALKEQDKRSKLVDPLSARPIAPAELDTNKITAITHAEAKKYRREYDRAVRNGDLLEVDEATYIEYLDAEAKRAELELAKHADLAAAREAAIAKEHALAEQAAQARKARDARWAQEQAARQSAAAEARTAAQVEAASDDDSAAEPGDPG